MSNRRELQVVSGRVALAVVLMTGVAGCTASPRYPIDAREAPGDGGLTPWQPRYPVSARDAARNAHDAADGAALPPRDGTYTPPPPPAAVPRAAPDEDDAPHALPGSPVDSSDLPPPQTAPHLMSELDAGSLPPGVVFASYAEASDGARAGPGVLLAAYHHHRHAAAAPADADRKDAAPHLRGLADTPLETTVRPGEKLADVAKRMGVSREALVQLNDIKHPKHVHAGTVLKAPYRYSYQVQKGDTLYTIAHRFDQQPDAVARLNALKSAALQPGQTVQLPASAQDQGARRHAEAQARLEAAPERMIQAALRRAEREDRRHGRRHAQVAAAVPPHARHGRGETAAEVATDAVAADAAARSRRTASVEPPPVYTPPPPVARQLPRPAAVASSAPATVAPVRPNGPLEPYDAGAGPPYAQRSGAVAPSSSATAYAAAGATATRPSTAPVVTAQRPASATPGQVATLNAPTYRPGYSPSLGRARPVEPELGGGVLSAAAIAQAGRGRFVWPMRGALVSGFGDHGAQHNDGLDISATPGEGVHAAAGGEVVYAGNSIPGFGNLVLLKHPGGWVTAYAHLDHIDVHMRDEVAQGAQIGQAGQTGAVDRPVLHFEVRYAPQPTDKARPVDPSLVLPAG